MLLVSSCNRKLSIQLAASCFGTFPIQSLGCRSVVSVLTHACPVRSNLLAACREMGLIKSLTEISPTLIWAMQKARQGVGGEGWGGGSLTWKQSPQITRTGWHKRLIAVTRSFGVRHSACSPFCLRDASSVLPLIRNQREKMDLKF